MLLQSGRTWCTDMESMVDWKHANGFLHPGEEMGSQIGNTSRETWWDDFLVHGRWGLSALGGWVWVRWVHHHWLCDFFAKPWYVISFHFGLCGLVYWHLIEISIPESNLWYAVFGDGYRTLNLHNHKKELLKNIYVFNWEPTTRLWEASRYVVQLMKWEPNEMPGIYCLLLQEWIIAVKIES